MSDKIYEPFKTGNIYKMRHGNVWATMLVSDQIMWTLEREALNQIRNSMELPGVKKLTITPDVHTGYGFAIGSSVESDTHLYPDVVGPDPACSVALSKINVTGLSQDEDVKDSLMKALKKTISVSHGREKHQAPVMDMKLFKEMVMGYLRSEKTWVNSQEPLWKTPNVSGKLWKLIQSLMTPKMLEQLGSIGGGNHFLSIDEDSEGNNYILSHFGSRGIGAAGAKWFDEAISRELEKWNGTPKNGLIFVPSDSHLGELYYAFQQAMLEWATYNHVTLHKQIHSLVGGGEFLGHIPHNFIELRNGSYVGRKGATPAYDFDGIPLLVPGSMSTGSYILRPGPLAHKLGESVSHGAGRVLSRGKAKENLDQKEVNKKFREAGVIGNFQNVPIDESQDAYKDVDEVVQSLVDCGAAEIENKIHSVLVLKGT